MNFEQWAIAGILLAMLVAYASERFRVELVAMIGLALGFVTGIVPANAVFAGFSSSAVITVVEVLLVVSAVSRTSLIDDFARRIVARTQSETAVLALLCAMAAGVSVFINNIGALALFFPVALSVCARLDIPPSRVLMPLSFATLLGGTCSLTGTPANLVVNEWVVAETGKSMSYFELALIGGPVTVAGLVWIAFAAPQAFSRRQASGPAGFDAGPAEFLSEMQAPQGSALVGCRVPDAESRFDLRIHGVMRQGAHVFARRGDIVIATGDLLLAEAEIGRLDELREQGDLAEPGDVPGRVPGDGGGVDRIEAVVMPDSLLLGSRIGDVPIFEEQSVRVSALASRRHRIEGAFGDLQIGMGDVLILSGERDALGQVAAECGLLALSRRRLAKRNRSAAPSVIAFFVGVLLCALEIVPPSVAFGGVVLALVLMGRLNLRTALQDLNWPVVIVLACMIPLGLAVENTGAARVVADTIADYLPSTDPVAVAALVLLMAVTITPFIDNVSTAVVLSPIAAGIAARTGVPAEPLLMAVAVGASLDFLTPFGHHNNAVVMGAAGYRFRDFARFGGPLLVVCLAVAILAFGAMLTQPDVARNYIWD
ncbi:MAG TPA: SLC13 family permease [Novosphingobium sp.]|nr:SLC13 family permease [Novosphingobium sp.]